MLIKYNLKFEEPIFDDMPPDEKSSGELFMFVLKNADKGDVVGKKYNDTEMNKAARYLILNGYLRGTIFDHNNCSWSRLTSKGRFLLESLTKFEANI